MLGLYILDRLGFSMTFRVAERLELFAWREHLTETCSAAVTRWLILIPDKVKLSHAMPAQSRKASGGRDSQNFWTIRT